MRLNDKVRSFFFSSRRRHTMSLRDWSSDVCSSDLQTNQRFLAPGAAPLFRESEHFVRGHEMRAGLPGIFPEGAVRSEERRVGKSVGLGGGRVRKKEEG